MQRRSGFTVIELLVVACVFLAMIAVLAPFVHMAKARSNRIYCANNLRQISLGLHEYALEHKRNFPATLGELYPKYVSDQGVFDCPAHKKTGTENGPDYDYTAGFTEASPAGQVMVQDKPGNHKKSGKNVLRVGGSVEWVRESR